MKKIDKSIANLLIEKDRYKYLSEEAKKTLKYILNKLYSIGAPLNDNVLKFNNKQLKFLHNIAKEVKYMLGEYEDEKD